MHRQQFLANTSGRCGASQTAPAGFIRRSSAWLRAGQSIAKTHTATTPTQHTIAPRASEALARFLFQQLVLALDFCHRKGKVSRDVKLANTLLALAANQLPLVKLCDFGYSKDTMMHSAPASQVRAC